MSDNIDHNQNLELDYYVSCILVIEGCNVPVNIETSVIAAIKAGKTTVLEVTVESDEE